MLTATRAQRGAVVRLWPRISRKSFTISEFARLIRAIPDHEAPSFSDRCGLVEAARSLRGFVPPPEDPDQDDIEDPYRQPLEVYEFVGARLDGEMAVIADGLRM